MNKFIEDFLNEPKIGSWEKRSSQEVIIKPELLDLSSIEIGKNNCAYRPQTLDEYIGQDNAKAMLMEYIDGSQKHNDIFPHIFLSAPPGHGKSLLANIVSNMIGKKIVECVGGDLKSEQQFIDKIIEVKDGILFIDEANMIRKKVGFFMLPIMEQFKINGYELKYPFSIIFATTHKGDLSKELDALIQRCDLEIELEHYTIDQLIIILKQFKNKQYPDIFVNDETCKQIALNCRQTPRLARRLLRHYVYTNNWSIVMQRHGIIKDGLNKVDVKVLKYLETNKKGVGRNQIANYLRIKPKTYLYEIEPYLIFKELIHVENNTKITDEGKQFLNNLKGE